MSTCGGRWSPFLPLMLTKQNYCVRHVLPVCCLAFVSSAVSLFVISMSFLRVSPFKDPGPCSPQATDEFLRRVGGIATKCAQGSVFCLLCGL